MIIKITKGEQAIIDKIDAPRIAPHKWFLTNGYAARWSPRPNRKIIKMHRVILGLEHKIGIVDHINRNRLDNRRSNLRIVTAQASTQNRGKFPNTSSFKGVTKHKHRWRARIGLSGKKIHLGVFDTPEAAAAAYDLAVEKYFGSFAYKNNEQDTPKTKRRTIQ